MIETVKDRVSISQLMRDLNLEVVYMPEKEEYFVESEDVNRTGLPLAGYFEYFPYERIQIIGKTEYTYFQNISKKEREEVVNSSWKDIFLKNSKGENLQMLRFWFYIQYNAEKNGKKYVSRSLALSESAIEYVYRGIPKRMEVLQDLFAQMKQMKLVKEDVVKNEIVVRPAKLEGLEIKNYIKDKPVDLMSFNYTNV